MDLKWFVELVERRPILGVLAVVMGALILLGTYTLDLQSDYKALKQQSAVEIRQAYRERDSAFRIADLADLKIAQNSVAELDKKAKYLEEELARIREENEKVNKIVGEANAIFKNNTKDLSKLKPKK